MKYWLVKSEPEVYAWADLQKEGRTCWSGVRNYQARNNLSAMKLGDRVLFYHSGSARDVVGVAEVLKEGYPDPTIPEDPRWVAVDLGPDFSLRRGLTLEEFKADDILKDSTLAKHSRLSVMPITEIQYRRVLELAGSASQ